MAITSGHLALYRRDGFVRVPGFVPEPAMLHGWVAEVQHWPEVPGQWMKYFEKSLKDGARLLQRVENFLPYHAALDRLAQGELREAVSLLFEADAVLFKDKINLKLPGGDGFKAHQDVQAHWDRWGSIHMTAMVAVDPVTLANGPVEFVAGRHREGLLGKMDEPLPEGRFEPGAYAPVTCQPGDAVFFDSFAPHRSGPNLSDQARRVLYITYGKAADGDHRARYFAKKRRAFPPDCERVPGRQYVFKV